MANLSISLPSAITKPAPQHRMTIKTDDGKLIYTPPLAPLNVSFTGFGQMWTDVPRPGKTPYLIREATNNPKMTFTLQVLSLSNPDADINPSLIRLKDLANTTTPIKIIYGGYFYSYSWHMTSMSFTTTRLHPVTSVPTWAEVNLEFTVARDVVLSTGPVSGGVKKAAAKKPVVKTKATTTTSKSATKTYVVKKGDTLSSIAIKVYKDASKWRALADKNKIKNANLIYVGQKIKF